MCARLGAYVWWYSFTVTYPICKLQVKGSTKIIVTVVATQELGSGDVLRRYKGAQNRFNQCI